VASAAVGLSSEKLDRTGAEAQLSGRKLLVLMNLSATLGLFCTFLELAEPAPRLRVFNLRRRAPPPDGAHAGFVLDKTGPQIWF
jgi:hypothetical protein